MTDRPSYAAVWRQRYEANREGYECLLHWDIFRDWERDEQPEVRSGCELVDGLRILWGGNGDLARDFFRRADRVIERTEIEKRLVVEQNAAFPRNRAAHLRTAAHVRNLLNTANWADTCATLVEAATDYAQWCQDYWGSGWDSQAQAYYLNAVRLGSIAGDHALVARLLATRRTFKWHSVEHQLLKRIASGERSSLLADELHILLDRLRNPDLRSSVFIEIEPVILELAVLHEACFGSGMPVDWTYAARTLGR